MGHVGPHVASALVNWGIVDELYVSDIDEDKARAECLDLTDSTAFAPRPARIFDVGADYEALTRADIIINTAGDITKVATSRDGELYGTTDIARTFVGRIAAAGFEGFWINVSNPCDVVTRLVHELSGLPASHVLGTGTSLDSARLRRAIAQKTGLSIQSVDAYMIGEHGASELAAFSQVSIAGKPLHELAAERPEQFGFSGDEVERDGVLGGYDVYNVKHCTEYGIGAAAARIAAAIVRGERAVLPASVRLDGQYGQSGFYISTPAVIGADGVEDIYELHLTDTEHERFLSSCEKVKHNYELVREHAVRVS
ncbi:L-lactate dehydrogenase [Brooklawnia cerclae]